MDTFKSLQWWSNIGEVGEISFVGLVDLVTCWFNVKWNECIRKEKGRNRGSWRNWFRGSRGSIRT